MDSLEARGRILAPPADGSALHSSSDHHDGPAKLSRMGGRVAVRPEDPGIAAFSRRDRHHATQSNGPAGTPRATRRGLLRGSAIVSSRPIWSRNEIAEPVLQLAELKGDRSGGNKTTRYPSCRPSRKLWQKGPGSARATSYDKMRTAGMQSSRSNTTVSFQGNLLSSLGCKSSIGPLR